jgi:hypothetical protein
MAEYKGIKGFKVQYLSADPSNPIIGQTWYNDTSKDLKYTEFAAAAWSSGTNLPRAQFACFGTPSAAVFCNRRNWSCWNNNSENWERNFLDIQAEYVSTARNQAAGFGTQIAG